MISPEGTDSAQRGSEAGKSSIISWESWMTKVSSGESGSFVAGTPDGKSVSTMEAAFCCMTRKYQTPLLSRGFKRLARALTMLPLHEWRKAALSLDISSSLIVKSSKRGVDPELTRQVCKWTPIQTILFIGMNEAWSMDEQVSESEHLYQIDFTSASHAGYPCFSYVSNSVHDEERVTSKISKSKLMDLSKQYVDPQWYPPILNQRLRKLTSIFTLVSKKDSSASGSTSGRPDWMVIKP